MTTVISSATAMRDEDDGARMNASAASVESGTRSPDGLGKKTSDASVVTTPARLGLDELEQNDDAPVAYRLYRRRFVGLVGLVGVWVLVHWCRRYR
jgi:hypothetical protein